MNNEKEKLSHLLDEYSSNDADEQSLDYLLGDVNQQYCLTRYQMIGQVMRHELAEKIDTGFCQDVMANIRGIKIGHNQNGDSQIEDSQIGDSQIGDSQIGDKPVVSQKEAKSNWRWEFLKPFAGMAVAASVAIVSITLWQSVSVTTGSSASGESIVSAKQQKIDLLVNQPIQAAVPASATLGNPNSNGMYWKVISDAPALERKLNAYLINHTEYSQPMQGLIPQARVAGYGSEK